MKRIYILYLTLNIMFIFGQKVSFEPTIKVEYDASLKLGEKNQHFQKFILIGNSQEYYFAGKQNYLNDTEQYERKAAIDTQVNSDYFQERLIRKLGVTNVFFTYADDKIRYEEKVNLKWVLYGDTKTINGVKCQMAAINKYGRRWIAYFSKEYSQSLGPYKFTGLPGLIFELYDTHDDYHFTLVKAEKFEDKFNFNLSAFKNYDKNKFLRAQYNLLYTMTAFPGLGMEETKYFQSLLEKRKKMENNPLELKPFE